MESATNAGTESSGTDSKYLLELCVGTRIIRIHEEKKEQEREREAMFGRAFAEALPRGFEFAAAKMRKRLLTFCNTQYYPKRPGSIINAMRRAPINLIKRR